MRVCDAVVLGRGREPATAGPAPPSTAKLFASEAWTSPFEYSTPRAAAGRCRHIAARVLDYAPRLGWVSRRDRGRCLGGGVGSTGPVPEGSCGGGAGSASTWKSWRRRARARLEGRAEVLQRSVRGRPFASRQHLEPSTWLAPGRHAEARWSMERFCRRRSREPGNGLGLFASRSSLDADWPRFRTRADYGVSLRLGSCRPLKS